MSKCLDIVERMDQRDQDAMLEKLDQYIAIGVSPEKAQRMAASDLLSELIAESAELAKLVEEQHPDPIIESVIPEDEAGANSKQTQGVFDYQPANSSDSVAEQTGSDAPGGQTVRAGGRTPATAVVSGGPGQPATTLAKYSQQDSQPDEDRAVAKLDATLRQIKEIEPGQLSILADPAVPATQALNALLDSFGKLTGMRGIAIAWEQGPYGLQFEGKLFVNTKDADVHVAKTIGHEFKHLSESFPGLNAIYDKLFALVGERGRAEYFSYLKRTNQVRSVSLNNASATELQKLKDEMMADFMGQRFNDKAWLEQLAKEEPSLFGEFVRDWLALLNQLIASLKGQVGAETVKNIDRYIAQLEEAKALAKEVAVIWAERNPKLASRVGVTEVQMNWKAVPGNSTGMLPGMTVAGAAKAQREHLMDIQSALGSVESMLGWGLAFADGSRYSETRGGASFKGMTGYAIQSTLALPGGKIDARTRNEIEFFLATRGLWLGLESLSWHAPQFGQSGFGVEINLGGQRLNEDQFEELAAAMRHEFRDYTVSPIPSKDGVRFMNHTGIDPAAFINKLKKAINDTSIYDIWKDATDTSAARGTTPGMAQGASAPLRAGSSDLQGGRNDDGNAFSSEGIRTFNYDGGIVANDWARGEGQFRARAVKAWRALKDLPGQSLPKTEAELNDYLAQTQARVDRVNAEYASRQGWGKSSLTAQDRATGVGASYEYPSSQIDTERAAGAYFRHPDGHLETLYHGTASIVTEVKGGVGPATKTGAVFYATSAPLYAEERALSGAKSKAKWRDKNVGASIIPVHILSNNPFDWRIQAHADAVLAKLGKVKGYTKDSLAEMLRDGDWRVIEIVEVLQAVKAAGFDSFLIRDDASQPGNIGIGLFNPEDVVFAIGLNGQKLAAHPDIKFSQRDIVGRSNRKYTPEQIKAFANVGFEVEGPSLEARAKALWKDAGKKLAQGIVDQFAPIKELSQEAYGLLRLSKGSSGSFETLLKGGMLKLSNGVYDFDESKKGGVIDKLLVPMQGEHHDFLRWVAANRAESLLGDGKENLFTQQDIDAIKTLANGTLDFDYTIKTGPMIGLTTRDREQMYRDSRRVFSAFNDNVLDMAEQSGLINQEERAMWVNEFYVPFYRVMQENTSIGGAQGGAVRKKAFKKIKGGTNPLNADLLDNTLLNWAHLLDASAKNRAAKASLEAAEAVGVAISTDEDTARQMGKAIGNKNGVVWFMDEGVPHYYLVDDTYVLQAITSLEPTGLRGPIMDALSAAKHMLTVGVTASPYFKVRNLIRDSIQVIGTSSIGINPIKNVRDGWKLTDPKNDMYFRLLAGGGTIHFGTMLEGSEAKRVQALIESGVDASTILNGEHKVKEFFRKFIEPGITAYNELGNRGEAINRAALYDQLVKQGVSHADASLQARDLMDFSMQGSSTTIRFLTQVLPFFNARLQGFYKLGRAAKEDPRRLAYVTAAVALASLSLLALYGDDDDWKKREDWDRDNFWWFKIGGTAFRIPKPFEIGAIGTLAERSAELIFDDEMTGTRFRKHVMSLLADNLSMNPVPQLVKPMLDVYANKDSYSGRPIETMGMERLKSDYRFTGSTSMTARAASTALNAATGLVGKEALSPVQVDSLIRGYFGWLGTTAVAFVDIGARYATDQTDRPSIDLWKTASGGMVVSDLRNAPSRYVTHLYEQAKVIEEAQATWRALMKQGNVAEAKEFRAANMDKINAYRSVQAIKGAITKINQRIRVVELSDMDRKAKRAEVTRLKERKNQFARRLKV